MLIGLMFKCQLNQGGGYFDGEPLFWYRRYQTKFCGIFVDGHCWLIISLGRRRGGHHFLILFLLIFPQTTTSSQVTHNCIAQQSSKDIVGMAIRVGINWSVWVGNLLMKFCVLSSIANRSSRSDMCLFFLSSSLKCNGFPRLSSYDSKTPCLMFPISL